MNPNINKILPHFGIVAAFFIAAILFFKPVVFENKSLTEHDNVQARGMQTEINKYLKKEGTMPLWTNQVFVGMPTYQLSGNYPNNLVGKFFYYFVRFGTSVTTPHVVMFLMMLFGYLALLLLKVDKWAAAAGALSLGFLTNNIVLFEAGHSVKIHAMAYIAPILAGTFITLRGKYLLGGIFTAVFFSAQVTANHFQITYYTLLLMGILGLAFLIDAFFHKALMKVVKGGGIIVVAVLLGIGNNLSMLWKTYEYMQESTRGKSELTTYALQEDEANSLLSKGLTIEEKKRLSDYRVIDNGIKTEKLFLDRVKMALGDENKFNSLKDDILKLVSTEKTSGLDKSYIFSWSLGKMETFSLMIPHFYGGSNQENFAFDGQSYKNTNSGEMVKKILQRVDPRQKQQVSNQFRRYTSQYWGAQPFTSGPNYFGAIICFLFFLGAFLVKGPFKWATVISTAVFIVLSWGDNFQTFNYFMVDYFPLYGKFRAVTMTLSVVQMMVVLLAIMGLYRFITYDDSKIDLRKRKGFITDKLLGLFSLEPTRVNHLYLAAGVSAAICIFAMFYSFTGSFVGPNDYILEQIYEEQGAKEWLELLEAIRQDRSALILSSAFRSLIFILLAAGGLWALATKKLKSGLLVTGIVGALAIIDLTLINRIYINEDSFKSKEIIRSEPPKTEADKKILQDKEVHFRVYDGIAGTRRQGGGRGNPFQNSEGGFFHKIVGGYHAAKPGLFQDLVDCYLGSRNVSSNTTILGMLNTKYIIQSMQAQQGRTQVVAVPNQTEALGNAWLIQNINYVKTADEEMIALDNLNPRANAVTRTSNKEYLNGVQTGPLAVSDHISLTSYHPEKMVYEVQAEASRLAVFSEIYYPPGKGWHVYIDGQRVSGDFIKVNYLLRGLKVPAGKHKVEFIFEPTSHTVGGTVALVTSIIVFLGLGFFVWITLRRKEVLQDDDDPYYTDEVPKTASPKLKEENTKEENKKKTSKKKGGNSSNKRKKK